MKKKIIIPIVICLVIGIIGFIIWNNRIVSTITLDINPSIKINLDKNENVKSLIALNDDAKSIIADGFKGKPLNELLYDITERVIDNGYGEEGRIVILLHSTGSVSVEEIQDDIQKSFEK